MEPLEKALAEHSIPSSTPCLPGHATNLKDFVQTSFADWYGQARNTLLQLQEQGRPVVVVGLSMGGSLGLKLAQEFHLAGLAAIAAPVTLYTLLPWRCSNPLLPLVPVLRHIKPVIQVPPPSAESNRIAPHKGYEGFQALHPLASLISGLRSVRRGLGRVTAPILLLHSPQDQTVPVANAWEIISRVSSRQRQLQLLSIQETETTRHVLTTHQETREVVAKAVLDFVLQVSPASGRAEGRGLRVDG
jgi:carboxylesterase